MGVRGTYAMSVHVYDMRTMYVLLYVLLFAHVFLVQHRLCKGMLLHQHQHHREMGGKHVEE